MNFEQTILIGIAGGSGSGKTYLSNSLLQNINKINPQLESTLIYQDNYYNDQSHKFDFDGGSVNFDHPDSIDFELMSTQLNLLKNNKNIQMPIYDFKTHSRQIETISLSPKKILLVDGILIFHHDYMRENFDLMVFVDTSEKLRYKRRLDRDVKERGRTVEGVYNQFHNQVKPMHDKFVAPSKEHAHIIVKENSSLKQSTEEIFNFLKENFL